MATTIKIFEMNDCEWWAAATLEDAIKHYKETYACGNDKASERAYADQCGEDEPRELGDPSLDGLFYTRSEDDGEPTGKVTFRKQLEIMVAEGCKFPCLFATTEY